MQDNQTNGHDLSVERLATLLKEELKNPSHATSEIRSIFLNFQNTKQRSEIISLLRSADCEVVELLLKNCDNVKNKGLWKICYPIIYSWVEDNTPESLELVSNFIPSLIWQFLADIGAGNPEEETATCLVRLVNALSQRPAFSFRLPSIHMMSVYHHPSKMQYTGGLTEASLSKGFNMEPAYTEPGPTKFESLNKSNRLKILTLLLQKYGQTIGDMLSSSLQRFCWLSMWLCASGMPAFLQLSDNLTCWELAPTRYSVDKDILIALLVGLQYCLYNGHSDDAQKALDVINVRAEYDIVSEAMLMASSLRDTIDIDPVPPCTVPFGLQMPPLQGTINDTRRPIRNSFIRQDDISLLRQRFSSCELREEEEASASVIVDCSVDSDDSDIHIANFRDGKLQDSTC